MLFKRSQILIRAPPCGSRSPTLPCQDQQAQSIFLNYLPAELKNEIYSLVFTFSEWSTTEASLSRPSPHPLSLLLTCRRVYHEAALLAFKTYTFPIHIGMEPTFLGLKSATSYLSSTQVEAVRSLSILSGTDVGSLLTNALLIFPHLEHVIIKTEARGRERCRSPRPERHRTSHPVHASRDWLQETELAQQAINRYAPQWFAYIVDSVADGKAFKWQTGSRWTARWPQMDSELCYAKIQCDRSGLREELYMDADAIGVVLGVQMCVCGCKDVSWTRAVLVQEGGRHVDVDVVYCDEAQPLGHEKQYVPGITLVPGTAPADKAVIAGTGIGYEADDEYWEAIRRRNGNLGALCRGLWKSAAVWPSAALISRDGY